MTILFLFVFFQAEDGIRDYKVTGVQTCALPIYSRINRIFEGTNEINRLIITGWLMKRAVAGQLPLLASIKKLMDEVMSGPSAVEEREGPLSAEYHLLANAKKLA